MKLDDPVVVVGYSRTPIGGFQGALAPKRAPELGSVAIASALSRAGVESEDVDEVLMGCVLPAGLGQAPARQAALGAGVPVSSRCTTVNKVCGSGMKSAMLGHDMLVTATAGIVVAGGMESMSNAPYLLDRARGGYRLGHGQLYDHMFLDGLEDAYDKGRLMGTYAEDCVAHYGFTRQEQDDYAIRSLERALGAISSGAFQREIAPILIGNREGETEIDDDEQPGRARMDRIRHLKPAFHPEGSVTAANSSSISDGAAALVLMRRSNAERRGLVPLAAIRGHSSHAQAPSWFTTAPIPAIRTLLDRLEWGVSEVDLFEINEAFAVVAMAAQQELGIPDDRLNVNGGACALGHPIGATGARIMVTLLAALENRGLRQGVAALCIGGGEATAIAIERLG